MKNTVNKVNKALKSPEMADPSLKSKERMKVSGEEEKLEVEQMETGE